MSLTDSPRRLSHSHHVLIPTSSLQAFSLPGSIMYLCCTGASLCYLISAAFGPALLTIPRWKSHLDKWTVKLASHKDNVVSYLIVLASLHCPALGLVPFWISTWLGVFGVTVIHTTIGEGDEVLAGDGDRILAASPATRVKKAAIRPAVDPTDEEEDSAVSEDEDVSTEEWRRESSGLL
ncbi:hypothetical protein EDD15DRAFT_2329867 [Pisolithus albus]|nr:hypothetical protein EDD15DRAFT_2329867 [Pisolithus albus]